MRDLDGLRISTPRLSSLKDVRAIARSRGILPSSLHVEFENHQDPRLAELGEDAALFSASRRVMGSVPDVQSVLALLGVARECHENLHAESSWNILVHSRLLDMALRPPNSEPFSELFSYFPW